MTEGLRAGAVCWCGSGRRYGRCHAAQLLRPGRVSPRRPAPEAIPLPDYAASGTPGARNEPLVKSADMIARLRRAGRIAAEVLAEAASHVAPGVTTDELDRVVHEACLARGAYPSPLNYRGYPKSVCTSVNEVICHGIPDDRPLRGGDIVNVDVTCFVDGVHGDTNATCVVGTTNEAARRLVQMTHECLQLGIGAVQPGRPLSDIGRAIERHAAAAGYGVVREFVGHGIGGLFHAAPIVPHYFDPGATTVMRPGMVFTIEPMITLGTPRPLLWPNGWTAVTADGGWSAQFEHTVLVTGAGAEVLTETDGEE